MYTKEDLKRHLAEMNFFPWDTVLVHSSMKSIGEVEGGADTVLDAFCEYFCDGLLIFPTHTWATINEKHYIYDPDKEPSCVGLLTNMFMKREGVVRSLHPTHSVAVLGQRAKEFIEGEENATTPCPRNGCWGRLIEERAKILFLGCPLTKFTFVHGPEEWLDIPDRLAPAIDLKIKMPDGTYHDSSFHKHQCSFGNVSDNFGKLTEPLLSKGIAQKGKFGDADCIIADAARSSDFVMRLLQTDPEIFNDPDPIPEEYYAVRRKMKISPSILACNVANLEKEINSVPNADFIHIDIMDGHFVPNLSFGVPIVKAVNGLTDIPLDLHLMMSNPSKYIEAFAKAGADMISVHYEVDEDLSELISLIESFNVKPAVALKPATPVEVVYPYLDRLASVLIMTVEPGFGGQSFHADCLEKVRKLRAEIRKRGLSVEIEVDGGINTSNIGLVSNSGVSIAVMGTALFKENDREAFVDRCKG